MDISRTFPQDETPDWVANLFNGNWQGETEFPFGRTVRYVEQGDFLYLIYRGRVHGRMRVTDVEQHPQTRQTIQVGTDGHSVTARTVVWVELPGELAPGNIPRDSHRGHRYDEVPEWPG